MLNFLNVNQFKKGLRPVTSTELWSKPGEFHQEGLFSEIIFGAEESADRKKTFSYINLNTQVIHPIVLTILTRLNRRVQEFISAQETFSLDSNGEIQVDPKGTTGISNFIKIFPDIKFKGGTADRDKFIKKINLAYKAGTLFIDIIPVIPPDQRPAYQDEKGMLIIDPLNDIYISIMRKAFQVKSTSKSGPLFDLLNFELQRAVLSHDEFIKKRIQKKHGIIRSSLLGKRTDFSARAVITPGPDLKVNEIGLPLRMAVSLFEPFLIHRLFRSGRVDQVKLASAVKSFTGLELSIDSIKVVFKAIKAGDRIPDNLYKIIFDASEVVMKDRAVLAKRDPVLHAESVRGFKPILVSGNTLKISTLQVGGFNADFDGDAMGVFHPITDEAQQEVKEKMMRNVSGESSNAVVFELSKEMAVGLYILTKNVKKATPAVAVTQRDLDTATDPYKPVRYRGKRTTMGKAIFNSVFPASFPFQEKEITKKYANSLIPIIIKKYGDEKAIEIFSKLEKIGFKFATIMAPTITLDDIQIPDEIIQMKEQLVGASTEQADALLKKMEKILIQHLKNTGIYDLVESGAAKGWGQPMQILVAKGIISDVTGKVLDPIKGSFSDGLTNKEYFRQSYGARKGIIDRVLNTADTGYMARKLAFVLNTAEIHPNLKDCGTKRHLTQRLDNKLIRRLDGRYVIEKNKVTAFKPSKYKVGDIINLRTPVLCVSTKFCHTCYGRLAERHRTPYAGIIAAQIIGEAGTQTIMRTFHTGGAVEVIQKNIIHDIVQNDPLVNRRTVEKHLSQQENELVCLKDCTLTLTMSDYPISGDMETNDDGTLVSVRGLVCKLEFSDLILSVILDYPVEIRIYNTEYSGRDFKIFKYKANSTILEATLETAQAQEQIKYVERLLGGREIYKDADHLFRKLFRVYGELRSSDVVHLEVLLSQVLRDKSNKSIPARLGKTWDPIMMNIKDIVFNTSFIQGLAFENIGKAINTGLITAEPLEPSILEKVMTGTLVEKPRR